MISTHQRLIKKRPGRLTKTTPWGIENKVATALNALAVADFKLIYNLFFFISFSDKRIKLSLNY